MLRVYQSSLYSLAAGLFRSIPLRHGSFPYVFLTVLEENADFLAPKRLCESPESTATWLSARPLEREVVLTNCKGWKGGESKQILSESIGRR